MSSFSKSILASSSIIIITKVSYSAFNALLANPNIEMYLKAKGYTSLFEAKKDNFTKWKRNYLIHKEELKKFIPELKDSEKDGAFLLKQWCKIKLNQVFAGENYSNFNLTQKYCTINIQNAILEEDDIRTVDEIPIEKRKQLFDNWEFLIRKCKDLFKIPYTIDNYYLFIKTKNMCSTKNWI